MATVDLADDLRHERKVALKVKPQLAAVAAYPDRPPGSELGRSLRSLRGARPPQPRRPSPLNLQAVSGRPTAPSDGLGILLAPPSSSRGSDLLVAASHPGIATVEAGGQALTAGLGQNMPRGMRSQLARSAAWSMRITRRRQHCRGRRGKTTSPPDTSRRRTICDIARR
jgi:hypothetical protein